MTNRLYCGDLPDGLDFGAIVAIDTEAMALNPHRDRLCLVQLSAGHGDADLVHQDRLTAGADIHRSPRLARPEQGSFEHRLVETAAELRLGSGNPDRRAASLRCFGCASPARAAQPTRHDAGARGTRA